MRYRHPPDNIESLLDRRTVVEIRERLRAAMGHFNAARLIAAPDYGLGFPKRDPAMAKLTRMLRAAGAVG
ncbi:MAG: hypothetical protein DSY90_07270 [Deltaproteobacteria bacterium]|nr:MAG: hypothetical protein DSY90_07270 [Deltaproteobacteria bacterium]